MAIPTATFFALVSLALTILFPMTEASREEVRRQLDAHRQAHSETPPGNELTPAGLEARIEAALS